MDSPEDQEVLAPSSVAHTSKSYDTSHTTELARVLQTLEPDTTEEVAAGGL
jgi:hypothetical protein